MAARSKSVVSDAEQVQLAAELARAGAGLALSAEGAIPCHVSTENLSWNSAAGGQEHTLRQRRCNIRDQAQAKASWQIQNRTGRKLVLTVLRGRAEECQRVVEIRRQRQQVLIA